MTVRPKDLNDYRAESTVLHCGECVVDYPARRDIYEWMFPTDLIVCAGCGSELTLEEKTLIQ